MRLGECGAQLDCFGERNGALLPLKALLLKDAKLVVGVCKFWIILNGLKKEGLHLIKVLLRLGQVE